MSSLTILLQWLGPAPLVEIAAQVFLVISSLSYGRFELFAFRSAHKLCDSLKS